MTKIADLHALMIDQLRDLLSAEKQLVQALPRMAKAAAAPELATALQDHLAVTRQHANRLEQALTTLGVPVRAKHCKGMEGLLEEGKEILDAKADAAVKDAGLIGAAQKVEHYEIAAYGTVVAMAHQMGHGEVARLLRQSLEEEKQADQLLTEIAELGVNQRAEHLTEPAEDEAAGDVTPGGSAKRAHLKPGRSARSGAR